MSKRTASAKPRFSEQELLDDCVHGDGQKLLDVMQTASHRRAVKKAFSASPEELGAAAVWLATSKKST